MLWQFALSHYVEKVRWALDVKGVPHVRRSLLPGLHINRIRKMTGQTAVPVFEFNGVSIHDSSAILEEVEKLWPEPFLTECSGGRSAGNPRARPRPPAVRSP